MSEPLDTVLERLGYVRRDMADQNLSVRADDRNAGADGETPMYPQVVIVQGGSTGESWVRDHAGQLLLAAGVGVFALTALVIAKAAAGGSGGGRRGR